MRRLAMMLGLVLSLAMLAAGGAQARSLQSITAGGTLTLCAHPNALPYASRHGDLPGLQVEIAEALARQIGVSLNRSWVFSAYQFRRAGCDIVLDAIGDRASLGEIGLRASRPYHKSGLTLAVRGDSPISALADLGRGSKVGVQVGSIAAMRLNKAGIGTSPFVFEAEMLEALAKGEIDAAAVTAGAVGWRNLQHMGMPLRMIPAFEGDPELSWDVAVGMVGPDDRLRQRMDAAIEALIADGTLSRLYARYGMTLKAP